MKENKIVIEKRPVEAEIVDEGGHEKKNIQYK